MWKRTGCKVILDMYKHQKEDNIREEKKKGKNMIFFKPPLLTNIKKNPHFGAWSLLLVHVWLTPSEGPKSF